MTTFDRDETDRLLSTTRAVRKRLDFERPVERSLLLECLRLAVQAPTASNDQGWRWLFIEEATTKRALAELYREAGLGYLTEAAQAGTGDSQTDRVHRSALFLAQNLERAPVLLVPCIEGRLDSTDPLRAASFWGSILPAVWSFQLALRSRGLGSTYTTLHLAFEKRSGEILGIPRGITQAGLLPIAHTVGTDFAPADRPPVETIAFWDRWGA